MLKLALVQENSIKSGEDGQVQPVAEASVLIENIVSKDMETKTHLVPLFL